MPPPKQLCIFPCVLRVGPENRAPGTQTPPTPSITCIGIGPSAKDKMILSVPRGDSVTRGRESVGGEENGEGTQTVGTLW